MSSERFSVARIDDVDPIAVAGINWHPVRRTFGVTAFGVNAYSADAGQQLIEEHDEAGTDGDPGQEEMYVVLAGRATFTVGGETVAAPARTVVFLPDPAVKRAASADEDGTFALAIGGRPGAALPVSAWEHYFAAEAQSAAGDHDGAIETIRAALTDHPDHPGVAYALACQHALAGRTDEAIGHLERAIALRAACREWAAGESDFDGIRDHPRFPA